jgi:hypothetical protein
MSDEIDPTWPPPARKSAPAEAKVTPQASRAVSTAEPTTATPRVMARFIDQRPPGVQAAITAALVAPQLAMYGALSAISVSDGHERAAIWGVFSLTYGIYFLSMLALTARDRRLMPWALLTGGVGVLVDTVFTWYVLSPLALATANAAGVVYTLVIVLYVGAWGIARRQHRNWVIGLPLTALFAGACQIGIYAQYGAPTWFAAWALYVGVFVVGCLVCWAFDAGSRLSKLEHPPHSDGLREDQPVAHVEPPRTS